MKIYQFYILLLVEGILSVSGLRLCTTPPNSQYTGSTPITVPTGGPDPALDSCTIVATVSTVVNFRCPLTQHQTQRPTINSSTDPTILIDWYVTVNGFSTLGLSRPYQDSLDYALVIDKEFIGRTVSIGCSVCQPLYTGLQPPHSSIRCQYQQQSSGSVIILALSSPRSLKSVVSGLSVTLSWSPDSTGISKEVMNTADFHYRVFIRAVKNDSTLVRFDHITNETSITLRSCELQEYYGADIHTWSVVAVLEGVTGTEMHADEVFQFNRNVLCDDGDTRLVDGTTCNEGRLEVCQNNTWGTVCDDKWSNINSKVVCDSLGIPGVAATTFSFGPGSGPILKDDVICTGNESNIFQCEDSEFEPDCVHFEDVGVICGLASQCEDGDIRLAGSQLLNQGRVEVCQLGVWGTVCDDRFTFMNARVACRQLGFTDAITFFSRAAFGGGDGAIVLDDLQCFGTESSLFDCPFIPIHDCGHFEDVGVVCEPNCDNGDVRLVAIEDGRGNEVVGRADSMGIVEVCLDNGWGYLSDSMWTDSSAMVVCNQLGTPEGNTVSGTVLSSDVYKPNTGVHHFHIECTGLESRLTQCNITRSISYGGLGAVVAAGAICSVTTNIGTTNTVKSLVTSIDVSMTTTTTPIPNQSSAINDGNQSVFPPTIIVGVVVALIVFTVVNIVIVLSTCLYITRKNRHTQHSQKTDHTHGHAQSTVSQSQLIIDTSDDNTDGFHSLSRNNNYSLHNQPPIASAINNGDYSLANQPGYYDTILRGQRVSSFDGSEGAESEDDRTSTGTVRSDDESVDGYEPMHTPAGTATSAATGTIIGTSNGIPTGTVTGTPTAVTDVSSNSSNGDVRTSTVSTVVEDSLYIYPDVVHHLMQPSMAAAKGTTPTAGDASGTRIDNGGVSSGGGSGRGNGDVADTANDMTMIRNDAYGVPVTLVGHKQQVTDTAGLIHHRQHNMANAQANEESYYINDETVVQQQTLVPKNENEDVPSPV